MFKDVIETVFKELQNEKNQEYLYAILDPFTYKIKISFYIVAVLLILIVSNLVYMNIVLSDLKIKNILPVS